MYRWLVVLVNTSVEGFSLEAEFSVLSGLVTIIQVDENPARMGLNFETEDSILFQDAAIPPFVSSPSLCGREPGSVSIGGEEFSEYRFTLESSVGSPRQRMRDVSGILGISRFSPIFNAGRCVSISSNSERVTFTDCDPARSVDYTTTISDSTSHAWTFNGRFHLDGVKMRVRIIFDPTRRGIVLPIGYQDIYTINARPDGLPTQLEIDDLFSIPISITEPVSFSSPEFMIIGQDLLRSVSRIDLNDDKIGVSIQRDDAKPIVFNHKIFVPVLGLPAVSERAVAFNRGNEWILFNMEPVESDNQKRWIFVRLGSEKSSSLVCRDIWTAVYIGAIITEDSVKFIPGITQEDTVEISTETLVLCESENLVEVRISASSAPVRKQLRNNCIVS